MTNCNFIIFINYYLILKSIQIIVKILQFLYKCIKYILLSFNKNSNKFNDLDNIYDINH